MAKQWSKVFYNSKEWGKVRELKMQQQYGLCERCNEPAKIVHHKIYLTPNNIDNPDISLNLDNLEALCLSC
jgi:5-methylcytosine-specific restriction endonuclease McrA